MRLKWVYKGLTMTWSWLWLLLWIIIIVIIIIMHVNKYTLNSIELLFLLRFITFVQRNAVPSMCFCTWLMSRIQVHCSDIICLMILTWVQRPLLLLVSLSFVHSTYFALASCKMGIGSFLGVKCGRGVLLTTHPLLVSRSWKNRATPLPTLWATPGL